MGHFRSRSFRVGKRRYNTSEIIVMDQVQKYMDGPRLLCMRLSEYIPQLSTRNVDFLPKVSYWGSGPGLGWFIYTVASPDPNPRGGGQLPNPKSSILR